MSAPRRLIVAGTDTNVGKTVFAAALTGTLDGYYWKPLQAGYEAVHFPSPGTGEDARRAGEGLDPREMLTASPSSAPSGHLLPEREKEEGEHPGTSDRDTVLALSGLPPERMLPEVYRLRLPAAPAVAAAAEGVTLDRARLARVPEVPAGRALVIEAAGGLLVPITDTLLQIDLVRDWGGGVVLVARTALGTINHTLLSLEALRARDLPVVGVAFVGEAEPEAERHIAHHGRVRRLGRLPRLARLDAASLAVAFAANFRVEDFAS